MRIEAVLPVRVKLAWRLLWYGEVQEPAPLQTEPWYDNLTKLINSPLSTCCERAVGIVEESFKVTDMSPLERFMEAKRLSQIYATSAGLRIDRMRPGTLTFLIEWWVAYKGGKF